VNSTGWRTSTGCTTIIYTGADQEDSKRVSRKEVCSMRAVSLPRLYKKTSTGKIEHW